MYSATYSPEDNKLRLYAVSRLDPETYKRVREAGFIWAPKQELFVAPSWTPEREDLLLEMCGEIGDEDTSLVDRAEQRAERFEEYSENRAQDADSARQAVARIADNIPLGQPILVGHHSEKHARKDAAKIENGMRRAVKMWEQSKYWTSRAAGAIHLAKYKERPDVRARRIKVLEADKRKQERTKADAEKWLTLWLKDGLTLERAKAIANYSHVYRKFPKAEYPASEYEGDQSLWSALEKGIINAEQARDISTVIERARVAHAERWITHLTNRLEYERAMLGESGGTVAERTGPEVGGGVRCWASPRGGWSYIQKVNKVSVSVLDNWGNGGPCFKRTISFDKLQGVMTRAEVEAKREAGLLVESSDKSGFFLRDAPPPERPTYKQPEPTAFDAMRDTLKHGVKVISAPQLFPTPAELASRMVELANVEPGQRILEPSAGTGNLVTAILAAKPADDMNQVIVAVEINLSLADALRARFTENAVAIQCCDFLEQNGNFGQFDRILMNPPFINGQDIQHIKHAITFLKPGGRLVAICANGPRQQEQLKPLAEESGGEWEPLPADTFKESGTGVNTVLLTIEA